MESSIRGFVGDFAYQSAGEVPRHGGFHSDNSVLQGSSIRISRPMTFDQPSDSWTCYRYTTDFHRSCRAPY